MFFKGYCGNSFFRFWGILKLSLIHISVPGARPESCSCTAAFQIFRFLPFRRVKALGQGFSPRIRRSMDFASFVQSISPSALVIILA